MKKILMPREGVLFQKDNSYRLDYKFDDGFVETKLWSAKGTQQLENYTWVTYQPSGKMVLTKKQFENYLFSENITNVEVEITFE